MAHLESPHEGLVRETLDAYRRMWMLARQAAEPFWTQYDLTMSQLKAAVILDARGPLSVSQVAALLAIGRPSASILVEQLVQANLVVREEDRADRRRSVVSLSPNGHEFIERLYHLYEPMGGWLEQLNDDELITLRKGLAALSVVTMRTLTAPEDTDEEAG